MKVVILAGGLGTRLSEETALKPKPMIEIGGKPIIWHIMKLYSFYGFDEFIICAGYKGYMFKEYFSNYALHMSDVTINLKEDHIYTHKCRTESWKITIVDTGESTMTGGRLLRIKPYIGDETFMLTYGDGVSDVNINELLNAHKIHNRKVTITTVKPIMRFGVIEIDEGYNITSFKEKNEGDGKYINGGFMVCEPDIFNYITDDNTALEKDPLSLMADHHKMGAYIHNGFWYAMDTLREKQHLESLWAQGRAPWKVWE
jgi:glucose-1-phosphate cytidylyltransferase